MIHRTIFSSQARRINACCVPKPPTEYKPYHRKGASFDMARTPDIQQSLVSDELLAPQIISLNNLSKNAYIKPLNKRSVFQALFLRRRAVQSKIKIPAPTSFIETPYTDSFTDELRPNSTKINCAQIININKFACNTPKKNSIFNRLFFIRRNTNQRTYSRK